jgi:hypothetical protein
MQGKEDEAEPLKKQVMETRKTKLGPDHPDTLTSMANLASTYRNPGRWDEAETLFVQVMETSKTKLGPDHPDTLTSMNNLAFTWKGQSRDAEAVQLMRDCVQRQKRVLGIQHPHSLSSRAALRDCLTLFSASHGPSDEADQIQSGATLPTYPIKILLSYLKLLPTYPPGCVSGPAPSLGFAVC